MIAASKHKFSAARRSYASPDQPATSDRPICAFQFPAIASHHLPRQTKNDHPHQTSPSASFAFSPDMNYTSVLKAIALTATLALTNSAFANPDLTKLIEQAKAKANQNAAEANVSTSVINGKGTITYNGKKVWQGPVKKDLKAFSKAVSSSNNGEQKKTEYAAVWDGNKLVWENTPGAGAALEPERKKQEKELKN